jgi:agmatine deiminase
VVEIPIDDSWARDTGPDYVVGDDGTREVVDFTFNAWGEKFAPYADDARLAERWALRAGHRRRAVPMVLEGGSIATDGERTLVTTEECLLHMNRNPTMTRAQIESTLADALGVEVIVWLPFGLALDDDTDGHVDNVAAFIAPGRLLLQGCSDPAEDDHRRTAINRRCAQGTVDARGRELEVVEVPVLPYAEVDGQRLMVPYLNLYVINGAVIVPTCGHPADDEMLGLIGSCYPGREVVPVPATMLALGGGGPHCITQQVPATTP